MEDLHKQQVLQYRVWVVSHHLKQDCLNLSSKQSYNIERTDTLHLSYIGQFYLLMDKIVSVSLGSTQVGGGNYDLPTQYADGVINLNLQALKSETKHAMAQKIGGGRRFGGCRFSFDNHLIELNGGAFLKALLLRSPE